PAGDGTHDPSRGAGAVLHPGPPGRHEDVLMAHQRTGVPEGRSAPDPPGRPGPDRDAEPDDDVAPDAPARPLLSGAPGCGRPSAPHAHGERAAAGDGAHRVTRRQPGAVVLPLSQSVPPGGRNGAGLRVRDLTAGALA